MANTNNTVTTSFKADISDLEKGIQKAKQQIKLANAEFKAAASGMEAWDKSAEGIQKKLDQLDKVLKSQTSILQSYEKQLALVVKEQGEDSKGADDLRIKIENQKAAINNTNKEIEKWEQALDEAGKELDETGKDAEQFDDSLEKTTNGGLNAFSVALGNLVSNIISNAIQKLKDLAKETIEVGKNFDTSMSKVGAVSGAAADELTLLRDKAKEMGSTTKFTATEAAEAFNYMAMAGWKTEDMLNGIDGVLNLAAASGADLATTSDIVTDALTAMGYGAGDAGRLADVMAAAASNANTNVEMMGATFQYAAPLVGALGMNMEDTAVAIGLMANAGIKGEKAGTALRSILTRLSTDAGASSKSLGALGTLTEELGVQFYNTDGSVRDLSAILNEARVAWADLTAEEQSNYAKKIAGQNAISGWLALMNASTDDVNKLTDAINNSTGAAENMAAQMLDNLGGDMTLFQSKLEGTQIALYEKFEPALRKGVDALSKLLDVFNWLIENGAEVTAVITGVATAVGTFMLIINKTAILAAFTKGITAIKTAMLGLNATLLANPIGIVIALIAGLVAAFVVLWNKSEAFREFWISLWEKVQAMASEAITAIKDFFSGLWEGVQEAVQNAYTFVTELWGTISEWFNDNVIQPVATFFTTLFDTIKQTADKTWQAIQNTARTIATWVNTNVFQPIIKFFQPVITFFREAFTIIKQLGEGAWNAIKLIWSQAKEWFNEAVIKPVKAYFTDLWNNIKDAASTAWEFIKGIWAAVSTWFNETVVQPVANFFTTLWEGIKNAASTAWENIKIAWNTASTWFNDTVIKPVEKFFTGMWDGLKKGAGEAWEGIKKVFSVVTDWFKNTFSAAWQAVKDVFSTGGKIFDGIKDGIVAAFKVVVNGIIKAINKIIAVPFNAINDTLDKIRNIEIAGAKPFANVVKRFTVPTIPELAQGGVLKRGQIGLLEGDGAEAVVPLDQNKKWINATAKALQNALVNDSVVNPSKSLVTNNYNFTQNNTSPKALSRLEIYRNTNNILQFAKGV